MDRKLLNGSWQFRRSDLDERLTGTVPGGVYSDLLAAGEIADPYERDNELDVQWVAESDWVYSRSVTVGDGFLDHDEHVLVCHGLDTVATVELNGTVVGESSNMHRRFEFDVGDALVPGENELEIRFHSPVEYSRERRDAHPYDVPTLRYPHDYPARNFVRKAQCHYGWDWGPCLPTMGIWRDVELVGHSGPRITYTKTAQDHGGDGVSLSVDVGLDVPAATDVTVRATVADAERTRTRSLDAGEREVTLDLPVTDPDLWWPNGYGDQPLYDLDVSVDADAGGDAASDRIGFREIELVREEDDGGVESDAGESFYFEVNGVSVFAKGANWIPADALHGRVDRERYDGLLRSATAANMNTIRVWGGGYYERDDFYERCDELGLLVWQDFMYACALYPADDDFLDDAAAEARYQVRRLANHPSVALWCGNNENEEGLHNWFAEEEHLDELEADYDALYLDTIGEVVAEEDPSRTYWPGSPSSGTDLGEPYLTERGDVHYWDVWHDGEPFAAYEETEPRFVSEFGYQSFPSTESLGAVLPESEFNPTSPLMEHHQRNEGGNGRILTRMTDNFRIPFTFEDFVYLSQVQQSMAMKTAIEHWRRLKPHTMGALYWQLNDLWPCASWSSLEYGGDWKGLQHVARRIYAPLLVSTDETDDGVAVWLTSDETGAVDGAVTVQVSTFDGDVLYAETLETCAAALESAVVTTVDVEGVVDERDDVEKRDVFVHAAFDGAVESYDAFEFFAPYKRLDLSEPELDVDVDGTDVTVSTDCLALWVALDAEALDGVFSDNYFHLAPGEERTISVDAAGEPADVAAALEDLAVTHLRSTY